jgi:VWFA-related protein
MRSCPALLLPAALAAFASAQQPTPQPEQDMPTFRTQSNLVVLNVSVFDKQGRIVHGLPRSAFKVYEDSTPQEIKVFRQEDVPVSLGLVIDTSSSMRNKRELVNRAAVAMVEASNPQDEVFVINFNEEPVVTQDFTSDTRKLENALLKIGSSGETAMRDALVLGLDYLRRRASKDKKVLVVVTDGEDNSSIQTLPRLIEAAQHNDVILYAVGLLGAEQAESAARARTALQELTLATGGRSWFPADVAEIGRITPEIAHEIRNQYVIGYTPANTAEDGRFRSLKVEVSEPDVTVRTRSGYYARKK